MRPSLPSLCLTILLAGVVPAGPAIAQTVAAPSPAPRDELAADPVDELLRMIEPMTLESRRSLIDAVSRLDGGIEMRISALRANGRLFSDAHERLLAALTLAHDKLDSLATATPETWRSVKQNAIVALRQLQRTLQDTDAGPEGS